MQAWQVSFTLSKEEWMTAEGALSDLFDALTVKPVRENDPSSPEIVHLIFADETQALDAVAQIEEIFNVLALDVPNAQVEALPDIDWLQHVYETLKPIDAGRFFVHGSHIKENIPTDKTPILIEAASGFGTGEHPTTKGCLLMLDALLNDTQPRRILDMGCGSAILSIAVAKIVPDTDVNLGVDIHAESVRVSKEHAKVNSVENRTHYVHGDGFHAPEVAANAPYDLVLANILAQPLIEMAPHMAKVATKDIILSGFTTQQRLYVETPYLSHGFVVQGEIEIDGWNALWLRKK